MRDLGSGHGASSPVGGDGSRGGSGGNQADAAAPVGYRDAEATQVIHQPTQVIAPIGATPPVDADTDALGIVDSTDGAGPVDVPPGGAAAEPSGIRRVLARLGGRGLALVAAGGLILVLAVLYLVDLATTSGEIERNTTIAGVDVGEMTPEQALAALNQQVVPGYAQSLNVDAHGEPVAVEPAAAGLTPDAAGSVAAAGTRSANPFVRLTSFFTSTDLPLGVQVDRAALEAFVAGVASSTDVAPVEGDVLVEGTAVRTVLPVTGRSLQVPQSVDAMSGAWISGGPAALSALSMPTTDVPVRATPERTEAAGAEASAILAAPLVLQANETPIEIRLDVIAAVTTIAPDAADGFAVAVDVRALRDPYVPAVEATQTTPQNATISIVDGAPVVAPSVPGRTVDWAATDAAIEPALRSANHTVPVSYVITEPELTTEKAQALGIREVVGEFTTGGFEYASGQNIKVVAQKVNGAIVQPHTTFALNEFTGPRGVEQGYIESGIIQDGRPARAVGGGISQFATTLYNAAYFAGMGDVTHTPHSYYISRYPPGREATVFDGEIELAFSNDYDTAVLIETIWTDEDITIRLWGTKTVQVESISGDRFDYTGPQRVVVPYGQACSPSGGSDGFSIVNTRVIRDLAGAEIRREDFTTVYNGQQNVVCEPAPTPATPPGDAAATGAAATDPAATDPAATDPAVPPAG